MSDLAQPDAETSFARPMPYDFLRSLRFLSMGRSDPTATVGPKEAWRATRLGSGAVTVQLLEAGDRLVARAWGAGAAEAIGRAERLFGLHDRPDEFQPDHPRLASLREEMRGLHLVSPGEVVHFLARNVVRQLVTWPDARRYWAALVRALGESAPGPTDLLLPPDAPALRDTAPAFYRKLGIGGRQARTLRLVGLHARRLEEATALPADERRRRLLAVPGLGPWTVEETLGIGLGDPDAVPVGDYHIPDMVTWALAGEPRGDDARMLALLEPFRGQRGRVIRWLRAAGLHAPRYGPRAPLRRT